LLRLRQRIEKDGAAHSYGFADASDFVDANVIHDDGVTALEGRNEDVFDVGQEGCAVHRSIQQERRSDAIVA
jgi:hypothetical protein